MGDKEVFLLERRSQIEVAAKSFMKHTRAGEPLRDFNQGSLLFSGEEKPSNLKVMAARIKEADLSNV